MSRAQIRLLLPLGAAVALSLTGDSTLYAVLPNQTETVGVGLSSVGLLLGVNRLIRIPGNPLAGVLNDRLGRRRLFLLGLSLGILSTLAYGQVRGFWPMLAARMLWGVSWSLINVGGLTMILDRSSTVDRGRMTGFYQVSYLSGLTFSPLLGGALTDALGFQPAIRVCAAVSALGLVLALVALPETRPAAGPPGPAEARRSPPRAPAGAPPGGQVDRRIVLAAILYLTIFFVSNGVLMSTISLYLGQRWGDSLPLGGAQVGVASLAGVMLALRALLGIVAGPAAGLVSDRLPSRWPVVWVGMVLVLLGFVLLTLPLGVPGVAGGVLLVALGSGAIIATLAALVGDLAAGSQQGTIVGGLATAGDIGSAAGPLLAYALAVSLDLRWVYLGCGAIMALGLALAVVSGRDRRPVNPGPPAKAGSPGDLTGRQDMV